LSAILEQEDAAILTRAERSVGPLELLTWGKVLSLSVHTLVEVDIVLLYCGRSLKEDIQGLSGRVSAIDEKHDGQLWSTFNDDYLTQLHDQL